MLRPGGANGQLLAIASRCRGTPLDALGKPLQARFLGSLRTQRPQNTHAEQLLRADRNERLRLGKAAIMSRDLPSSKSKSKSKLLEFHFQDPPSRETRIPNAKLNVRMTPELKEERKTREEIATYWRVLTKEHMSLNSLRRDIEAILQDGVKSRDEKNQGVLEQVWFLLRHDEHLLDDIDKSDRRWSQGLHRKLKHQYPSAATRLRHASEDNEHGTVLVTKRPRSKLTSLANTQSMELLAAEIIRRDIVHPMNVKDNVRLFHSIASASNPYHGSRILTSICSLDVGPYLNRLVEDKNYGKELYEGCNEDLDLLEEIFTPFMRFHDRMGSWSAIWVYRFVLRAIILRRCEKHGPKDDIAQRLAEDLIRTAALMHKHEYGMRFKRPKLGIARFGVDDNLARFDRMFEIGKFIAASGLTVTSRWLHIYLSNLVRLIRTTAKSHLDGNLESHRHDQALVLARTLIDKAYNDSDTPLHPRVLYEILDVDTMHTRNRSLNPDAKPEDYQYTALHLSRIRKLLAECALLGEGDEKSTTEKLMSERIEDAAMSAQGLPKERPREQLQEMPQESPQERSQEMAEESPQDLSQEMPQGSSQDLSQEMHGESSQEQSQEMPRESPQEQSQGMPRESPQEQSQEIAQESPQDLSQESHQEQAQEILQESPQESPQEMSQGTPRKMPQETSQDMYQESKQRTPQEMSQDLNHETPDKISRDLKQEDKEEPEGQPSRALDYKGEQHEASNAEVVRLERGQKHYELNSSASAPIGISDLLARQDELNIEEDLQHEKLLQLGIYDAAFPSDPAIRASRLPIKPAEESDHKAKQLYGQLVTLYHEIMLVRTNHHPSHDARNFLAELQDLSQKYENFLNFWADRYVGIDRKALGRTSLLAARRYRALMGDNTLHVPAEFFHHTLTKETRLLLGDVRSSMRACFLLSSGVMTRKSNIGHRSDTSYQIGPDVLRLLVKSFNLGIWDFTNRDPDAKGASVNDEPPRIFIRIFTRVTDLMYPPVIANIELRKRNKGGLRTPGAYGTNEDCALRASYFFTGLKLLLVAQRAAYRRIIALYDQDYKIAHREGRNNSSTKVYLKKNALNAFRGWIAAFRYALTKDVYVAERYGYAVSSLHNLPLPDTLAKNESDVLPTSTSDEDWSEVDFTRAHYHFDLDSHFHLPKDPKMRIKKAISLTAGGILTCTGLPRSIWRVYRGSLQRYGLWYSDADEELRSPNRKGTMPKQRDMLLYLNELDKWSFENGHRPELPADVMQNLKNRNIDIQLTPAKLRRGKSPKPLNLRAEREAAAAQAVAEGSDSVADFDRNGVDVVANASTSQEAANASDATDSSGRAGRHQEA